MPNHDRQREQHKVGQDTGVLEADFIFRAPFSPVAGNGAGEIGFLAGQEINGKCFAHPVGARAGVHLVHAGQVYGQADFGAGSRSVCCVPSGF